MGNETTLRKISGVIAVLGLAVATYIVIADSGGGAPACLAGGGGCETVADSEYSHLLGINVALFGIAGYIGLIVASILPGDSGRFSALLLALVGVGFSGYLTYLELFVIDAICQWCVASAVLMVASLAFAAIRAVRYLGAPAAPPPPAATPAEPAGP